MKADSNTTLSYLRDRVEAFSRKRNWEHYHNPKDLAIALSVESSELLDIFKWKSDLSVERISPKERTAIEEEMADVLIYLLNISDSLSVDLTRAMLKKLVKNAKKYPVKKSQLW